MDSRLGTVPAPHYVHRSFIKAALFVVIILLGMASNGCWRVPVLGPTDKPDFAAKPWTAMKVRYWVRTSEQATSKRVFEVTDRTVLQNGFKTFGVKEVKGNSLGATGQLRLTNADGEVWDCHFTFEDRFNLMLSSIPGRSYIVYLDSDAFYDWMRNLCLENERRINPHAETAHIILCRMGIEEYPILTEQAQTPE